jgi:hypothetical protein
VPPSFGDLSFSSLNEFEEFKRFLFLSSKVFLRKSSKLQISVIYNIINYLLLQILHLARRIPF